MSTQHFRMTSQRKAVLQTIQVGQLTNISTFGLDNRTQVMDLAEAGYFNSYYVKCSNRHFKPMYTHLPVPDSIISWANQNATPQTTHLIERIK